MAFKLTQFGSDSSNIKSILGGVNYYRYYNKDNDTITTAGYFPADLGLEIGDRIAVIPSTKTNADQWYVVSSISNRVVTVAKLDTCDGVDSINGQTGAVSIKSVDGNSLIGSGNIELSTYLPYPSGWTTNGTTKELCDDIAADASAIKAKAYLGEVTCSDLPGSIANSEIRVEIMEGTTAADKVIVLTLSSGNVAPYLWQYVYWNNGSNVSGWIGFQQPLTTITGYDATKNQTLQNLAGTLTWVDNA